MCDIPERFPVRPFCGTRHFRKDSEIIERLLRAAAAAVREIIPSRRKKEN